MAEACHPAYLARFTLVVGGALVLWTVVGQAAAEASPQVHLPCQRKGPGLALLRVGIREVAKLAWRVSRAGRFLRAPGPSPTLRRCAGLHGAAVIRCKGSAASPSVP
jgi:hypothetical protein